MRLQSACHLTGVLLGLVFGMSLAISGCRDTFSCHDCCEQCPPRPSPYPAIVSEQALIKNLERAYQRRDYDKFTTLFSNPTLPVPAQPAYLFLLSEPSNGETSWGYAEEMRIARRMFRPQDTLPGETPVPPELWLQSVNITLTPQTEFVERTDLYRSPTNPDGLDPTRWKATEATYATYVFFQLAGDTDYQVNGRANFVVIQDLMKTNADIFKWLIYRWEDLGGGHPFVPDPGGGPVVTATWSHLKSLYAK